VTFHASSRRASRSHAISRVIRRNMNRRHMTDDHHGRTAGRATLLVRVADEILGTHRPRTHMQLPDLQLPDCRDGQASNTADHSHGGSSPSRTRAYVHTDSPCAWPNWPMHGPEPLDRSCRCSQDRSDTRSQIGSRDGTVGRPQRRIGVRRSLVAPARSPLLL
jgi:hypothetical protein